MCDDCAQHIRQWLSRGNISAALEIEMRLAGISFNREFEMPIFYKEQGGTRRVDFLVEQVISVETKVII